MTNDAQRAAVVAETISWVRTPYRHLGDIKGVGVDCAMLLVRVYAAVGIVPPEFDPRPYEPEWFLHRDEERYLMGMDRYAHRIELADMQPGDMPLYRFGRTASHGSIYIGGGMIVHAYRKRGNVELCEMRALVDANGNTRLDSVWSAFA